MATLGELVTAVQQAANLFGVDLSIAAATAYGRALLPLGTDEAIEAVRRIPSRCAQWPPVEHVLADAHWLSKQEPRAKTQKEPSGLPADNPFERFAREWEKKPPRDDDEGIKRLRTIVAMLEKEMS